MSCFSRKVWINRAYGYFTDTFSSAVNRYAEPPVLKTKF